MELALRLGPEKLAEKLGDTSECGQDIASELYATAKRLDTDTRLAKTDLRRPAALAEWRDLVGPCIDGFCDLAYGLNGGGTMWLHHARRNDATLEDFLAEFSKRFPPGTGTGDPKAAARLDRFIAAVAKLEIPKDVASEANPEMRNAFSQARTETLACLKNLKLHCSERPATQAAAVIGFVLEQAKDLDILEP